MKDWKATSHTCTYIEKLVTKKQWQASHQQYSNQNQVPKIMTFFIALILIIFKLKSLIWNSVGENMVFIVITL
jgi:hypothetical protein